MDQSPWGMRALTRQIPSGRVIMTMDISYAMLFLLWLAIVAFMIYGVWKLVEMRGR